uniref:Uncharacterized protein n=1 Tax=Ditylenchus dipsaci TaxID=166011 RepID=A0A915E281_9BILA
MSWSTKFDGNQPFMEWPKNVSPHPLIVDCANITLGYVYCEVNDVLEYLHSPSSFEREKRLVIYQNTKLNDENLRQLSQSIEQIFQEAISPVAFCYLSIVLN